MLIFETQRFLALYKGIRYYLQDFRESEREPQNGKDFFNYRHSSLCNVIERIFGSWKSRFRILRQDMTNYDIDTQVRIVITCLSLYFLLREHQNSNEIFIEYEYDVTVIYGTNEQVTMINNAPSFSWADEQEKNATWEKIIHKIWKNLLRNDYLLVSLYLCIDESL